MTNRAFLIAKDTDAVSSHDYDEDEDNQDEYDDEATERAAMEILAASGIYVPLLWLSLFKQEDVRSLALGDEQFLIPVTTTAKAKQLLIERQTTLRELCALYSEGLTGWNQLIESINATHIRLEGIEIWGLSPEQYVAELPAAIRWFDSKDANDFAKLLDLIGAESNSTIEHLRPTAGQSMKTMLHGYQWVREVPWED